MRELNIDWTGLHRVFQMSLPEVRCFLSLKDGRVVKVPPGSPEMARVAGEAGQYAPIEAIPSRIQYQWLSAFISSINDEALRNRMEAAVNGKGAFRRFKDILLTLPEERRRWFEFRDHLMRQRIVEWIHELGLTALNEPPWEEEAANEANETPQLNNDRDIEALRDFLIEWVDGQESTEEAVRPTSLEKLAHEIAVRFRVQAQ